MDILGLQALFEEAVGRDIRSRVHQLVWVQDLFVHGSVHYSFGHARDKLSTDGDELVRNEYPLLPLRFHGVHDVLLGNPTPLLDLLHR